MDRYGSDASLCGWLECVMRLASEEPQLPVSRQRADICSSAPASSAGAVRLEIACRRLGPAATAEALLGAYTAVKYLLIESTQAVIGPCAWLRTGQSVSDRELEKRRWELARPGILICDVRVGSMLITMKLFKDFNVSRRKAPLIHRFGRQ